MGVGKAEPGCCNEVMREGFMAVTFEWRLRGSKGAPAEVQGRALETAGLCWAHRREQGCAGAFRGLEGEPRGSWAVACRLWWELRAFIPAEMRHTRGLLNRGLISSDEHSERVLLAAVLRLGWRSWRLKQAWWLGEYCRQPGERYFGKSEVKRSDSAPVSRVELKGFVEESGVRCEQGRCMFMFLVVHWPHPSRWGSSVLFRTKACPGHPQGTSPSDPVGCDCSGPG